MTDPFSRLRRFLRELKRRKVYRVAAVYAGVAFVTLQAARLIFPATTLQGVYDVLVVIAFVGFPIALVLAWAFEVTPEGVRRTPEAEPAEERAAQTEEGLSTAYKVLVGLGLMAAAVAGGWYLTGGRTSRPEPVVPGMSEPDSTRVAVFPFTVRGGDGLGHWGEGMVELLGRSLDGAGSLTTVDPNTLLGRLSGRGASPISTDSARFVAARMGAGRFVRGSIYQLADGLRLSATWYQTNGAEIGSAEVTGQSEANIQDMVNELARAAIADLVSDTVRRRQRLAAQTTSSVKALKSYLAGQEALRKFDFETATQALSQAVEQDSTFGLAHYRLSMATSWEGRHLSEAQRAARRAVKWSDGLPKRDRLLLRAYEAYITGRPAEAERLYRTLRQRNPGDAEAAYLLGETLLHFNPLRGREVSEARDPFYLAMHLDPTFFLPLMHRVQLAVLTADTARLDSLTQRSGSERLAPEIETHLAAIRGYLLSSTPDSALIERLQAVEPFVPTATHILLFAWDDDRLETASPLDDVEFLSTLPEEAKAAVHLRRADVRAGRGQLDGARRAIDKVADFDSAAYWIARGQLVTLPFVADDQVDVRDRRETRMGIRKWDASRVPERLLSHLYLLPRRVYPAGGFYLLGLLAAADGDWKDAQRAAIRLDSMKARLPVPSAPADFARSIRAEMSVRKGDVGQALKELQSLDHQVVPILPIHPLLSAARERFLRARLLEEQKRYEEALTWYRTFGSLSWGELPYLAPAQFGMGRTLSELGRTEEAAQAYRRGIDLWEDADSILQPRVEAAREQLNKLTASNFESDD